MVKIIIRNQIETATDKIVKMVTASNNGSTESVKALAELVALKDELLTILDSTKYELLEYENIINAKSFLKLRTSCGWSLHYTDSIVLKVLEQELSKIK